MRIFSYSSAQDLLKVRKVCKQFDRIVSEIFSNIVYMDVFKLDPEDVIDPLELSGLFFFLAYVNFLNAYYLNPILLYVTFDHNLLPHEVLLKSGFS